MTAAPVVQVPGKLFLSGEYAVLSGAPAIVAAAGRFAHGQFVPGAKPSSPVVAAVMEATRSWLALHAPDRDLPPGAVAIDTTAFMHAGSKLGLGSSAAAAVATVGAAFEFVGLPMTAHVDAIAALADAGHRAAQGGAGSGGDVAASARGGFLRFVRRDHASRDGQGPGERGAAPATTATAVAPVPGLVWVTFFTRTSSRTVDFLAGVNRWAKSDPHGHAAIFARLSVAAHAFADAFSSDVESTLTAARDYGAAMEAMGVAAGLPIVTTALGEAMRLAEALGGAAKPSGAGGGDMGIALFAGKESAAAFAARCSDQVLVLDIPLGVAAARRVAPGDVNVFKKD